MPKWGDALRLSPQTIAEQIQHAGNIAVTRDSTPRNSDQGGAIRACNSRQSPWL